MYAWEALAQYIKLASCVAGVTDHFHVVPPQLWNLMMRDTPLEERITKQWGDLGFQGKDPQTDFRGMGML